MSKHSVPDCAEAQPHGEERITCQRSRSANRTSGFCASEGSCLEDYQGCIWQQAEAVMGAQFRFVASRLQKDLEYLQRLGTCSDPTEILAQTERFFTDMAEDYTVHSNEQYEALQDQLGTGIAAAQRLGQITASNFRHVSQGE